MAAPIEVPEGFEKLPDGRWAVDEEMMLDIGNTLNDQKAQKEVLKAEKKALQEALQSEREKVAEIKKEFDEYKNEKDNLIAKKDDRIDNLLKIVYEQNRVIETLNKDLNMEKLKWAGGGTLAGAFAALVAILALSN